MRPLFRRLSYEHVAIPGRHNRSTSTSQGSSDMSRFRFTSRMRTILSFDLISPNSPGRSPSIASGVVCNQPSMNGNRAHLGSAAALEAAPGWRLVPLLNTPIHKDTNISQSFTFSGPDVTDYELAFQGGIGSGPGEQFCGLGGVARLHTPLGTGIFSGCLDNVSMVQATEDRAASAVSARFAQPP